MQDESQNSCILLVFMYFGEKENSPYCLCLLHHTGANLKATISQILVDNIPDFIMYNAVLSIYRKPKGNICANPVILDH